MPIDTNNNVTAASSHASPLRTTNVNVLAARSSTSPRRPTVPNTSTIRSVVSIPPPIAVSIATGRSSAALHQPATINALAARSCTIPDQATATTDENVFPPPYVPLFGVQDEFEYRDPLPLLYGRTHHLGPAGRAIDGTKWKGKTNPILSGYDVQIVGEMPQCGHIEIGSRRYYGCSALGCEVVRESEHAVYGHFVVVHSYSALIYWCDGRDCSATYISKQAALDHRREAHPSEALTKEIGVGRLIRTEEDNCTTLWKLNPKCAAQAARNRRLQAKSVLLHKGVMESRFARLLHHAKLTVPKEKIYPGPEEQDVSYSPSQRILIIPRSTAGAPTDTAALHVASTSTSGPVASPPPRLTTRASTEPAAAAASAPVQAEPQQTVYPAAYTIAPTVAQAPAARPTTLQTVTSAALTVAPTTVSPTMTRTHIRPPTPLAALNAALQTVPTAALHVASPTVFPTMTRTSVRPPTTLAALNAALQAAMTVTTSSSAVRSTHGMAHSTATVTPGPPGFPPLEPGAAAARATTTDESAAEILAGLPRLDDLTMVSEEDMNQLWRDAYGPPALSAPTDRLEPSDESVTTSPAEDGMSDFTDAEETLDDMPVLTKRQTTTDPGVELGGTGDAGTATRSRPPDLIIDEKDAGLLTHSAADYSLTCGHQHVWDQHIAAADGDADIRRTSQALYHHGYEPSWVKTISESGNSYNEVRDSEAEPRFDTRARADTLIRDYAEFVPTSLQTHPSGARYWVDASSALCYSDRVNQLRDPVIRYADHAVELISDMALWSNPIEGIQPCLVAQRSLRETHTFLGHLLQIYDGTVSRAGILAAERHERVIQIRMLQLEAAKIEAETDRDHARAARQYRRDDKS